MYQMYDVCFFIFIWGLLEIEWNLLFLKLYWFLEFFWKWELAKDWLHLELIFRSIDKVSKVTSPVLVIHGTEDEVIDFSHGIAIHDKCPKAVEPLWVEVLNKLSQIKSICWGFLKYDWSFTNIRLFVLRYHLYSYCCDVFLIGQWSLRG